MDSLFNFWRWFFRGSGGKPGYRRLADRWLIIHLAIGVVLAVFVQVDIHTAANTVLLPLAGILVGLSFAWAGNAQGLMQTSEIEDLAEHHEGGFLEYVFVYQTAILVILLTMVLWGLTGLRVFDIPLPAPWNKVGAFILKTSLFSLSSMTLRECWHVVMGAQWMLLARSTIKTQRKKRLRCDGQVGQTDGQAGPNTNESEGD